MAAKKSKHASQRPEHQVTGRDYPGEWARQIELWLDEEPRRVLFYGGLFATFVLAIVIVMLVSLAI
jgi:hypothetical protein